MRRLVAALACRNGGSRLYGKPMQHLAKSVPILGQILDTIDALPEIETSVLGVAEGAENAIFAKLAEARKIIHVVGDERDVLSRLIACGRKSGATDIFRVTTECPFIHCEMVAEAWRAHIDHRNDITVTDKLPDGASFEIYTLESLQGMHDQASDEYRSEIFSRYAKQRPDEFKIQVLLPEPSLQREDLRLTVDYPEDLVLCRKVYAAFQSKAPLIPLSDIVQFLDRRRDLKALVEKYVSPPLPWPASSAAVVKR